MNYPVLQCGNLVKSSYYLTVAGGLARTLQFMEILDSGESSAYTVSKGSSSNMGPKPVASSETQINFIVKSYNQ